MLARSGLRISEAIGYPGRPEQTVTLAGGQVKTQQARPAIPPLKVSDINLTAHTIRVLHTKSGKPQTRGFHPSATDALARWFDVRRQLGFNGRQPAFSTLQGAPYPSSTKWRSSRLKRPGLSTNGACPAPG